jgi:hypothetical protein
VVRSSLPDPEQIRQARPEPDPLKVVNVHNACRIVPVPGTVIVTLAAAAVLRLAV